MKHFLHAIPMGKKFVLALALPLLAMLYFAVMGIVERQQTASNMLQLQNLTSLAQQAGDLVHEIQVERGMTAGFLGSQGREFRQQLTAQRTAVDNQADEFRIHLETLSLASIDADLASRVDDVLQRLAANTALRQRVDELSAPTAEALAHYTGINGELMALVGEMSHATQQADVANRLSAYYNLLKAKDLAGIERALLSNAFGADQITPALYQRFMTLIGEEAAFQASFLTQTTEAMRSRFEQALSGPDIERVMELRALVISRADRGGFDVDPQQWFEWQTVKIGQLKSVENAVASDIIDTTEALRSQAQFALWQYVAIAVMASLLASWVAVMIVRAIVLPLKRVLEAISHRGGDLTQRLTVPGSDELSQLYQAFNDSTAETETLVSSIKKSALSVELASGEIAQGNQDLAQRTEEQSASLVETATSMEQITATVRQTADHAQKAQGMSSEVVDQAQEANTVSAQARDAMQQIHDANQQVSTIVAAIDNIAFQTNILALNASVEAARAGEHGRGFAVVATEVRNLANRSAEEAKQIRQLIQHNVGRIEEGNQLVAATGDTLEAITGRVNEMASLISNISTATTEQSAGIEQINQAIAQLEEVTQQNAALVEQAAAASKSLDEQAGDMAETISQFQVSEAADTPALEQHAGSYHREALPA
ncbi:nitrate- and nitrite sensing domain-containing protein [Halomonas sp. Bachu 37]|uniref:methyl-accepting chemotaxis protein n=1 Tax=Halomonas kashgarensis TaxID=3084920 RepID=UPI003216E44F